MTLLATACLLLPSQRAAAQAWTPTATEGRVWFTLSNSDIGNHLFGSQALALVGTREVDMGDLDSNTATVGMTYGLTRRFAVSADLAYIESKYTGTFPENPVLDDGDYHGSTQDLRLFLRWKAFDNDVYVITPYVGGVIPSADYETFAHVAVGSGLYQVPLGIFAGRSLGRYPKRGFVQAAYTYWIVEDHEEHGLDRSTASLDLGWFLGRRWTLRGTGGWTRTHGGIDWTAIHDEEEFHAHDAYANADHWSAGASVTFLFTPAWDLSIGHSRILDGENTHELNATYLATSYRFGSWGPRIGAAKSARKGTAAIDSDLAYATMP